MNQRLNRLDLKTFPSCQKIAWEGGKKNEPNKPKLGEAGIEAHGVKKSRGFYFQEKAMVEYLIELIRLLSICFGFCLFVMVFCLFVLGFGLFVLVFDLFVLVFCLFVLVFDLFVLVLSFCFGFWS